MQNPIGLFDSGFGGLTVMRALVDALPHENLIYFADANHLPYGNKDADTIVRLAFDNANFLLSKKIKLLLIPCHTACCHALVHLQKKLDIPVVGVIEPSVQLASSYRHMALLGTSSTIDSKVYQSLFSKCHPHVDLQA